MGWQPGLATTMVWAEERDLSQMPSTTWFGQGHPLPFVTRAAICKKKTLTVCLAWGKVFPLMNLFNQHFAQEESEPLEI